MERFKDGEEHKRRQAIIDDMLKKANEKANEASKRKQKLPEMKLRPVVDLPSRPTEGDYEPVQGMQIVGAEHMTADEQKGDKADRWLRAQESKRNGDDNREEPRDL